MAEYVDMGTQNITAAGLERKFLFEIILAVLFHRKWRRTRSLDERLYRGKSIQ